MFFGRRGHVIQILFLVVTLTTAALLNSCITPQKNEVWASWRSEVQSVVKKNLNQVRDCYEQFLQRRPNTSTKITSVFFVTVDGRVEALTLKESGTVDSDFIACLTKVIESWQFPPSRHNKRIEVFYPFVFNPL